MLTKPVNVANDPVMSAKWDEITTGRRFRTSDVPTLSTLCAWYKVLTQAMDEMENFDWRTAYTNDMGDLKSIPQISTMKTASAEIRQINKQLGIADGADSEVTDVATSKFAVIAGRRAERKSAAAN